ncbi:MAG TPA: cytochrome c [Chthoniobacterales bacterium]|jgi:mono/diheme cytochrome c family protein
MNEPTNKIPEFLIPQKYPKNEMGGKMDYDESSDVARLHGAVGREKGEPGYGGVNKAVPGWLIAIFCVLLFWSGGYLGAFSGGFKNDVFNDETGNFTSGKGGEVAAGPVVEKTPVELGKIVYTANCQSCHQANGNGVAGQYPPLAGSEWVVGSERRLAMLVLRGLQGEIQVKGATYNGAMPAWASSLNDKKIANVLTYIRQEWGNKAPEVAEAGIAALRAETASQAEAYHAKDLLAVPEDATLAK